MGRRGNHVLLAARPIVDPLWEDWGRDGQIKTVRDMCRVCPTAGRSATGLVRILITAKMWHSCSRLNCIVSAHVALIASSIYAFCPFAARYFSALLQSMPTTAGCAADLYQRTILFLWFRLDHAAPFCVAGVAQPYIHLRFTWQVWHKLTSTLLSRGRRGTNSHLPSFRVAGVAQTRIYLRFRVAGVALMAWGGALGCGLGAR